jgi:hypothetical protein
MPIGQALANCDAITTPIFQPRYGHGIQDAASLANGATTATRLNGDMLQHTRALEATMASNSDPKFKNSKFLQFLSKMSNGEVILEDNQVCSLARLLFFTG